MKKEEGNYLEPIIIEKKVWNQHNLFISLLIALGIIVIFTLVINLILLTLTQVLTIFLVIIIMYAILLFFLLEPHKVREIKQPILRVIPQQEKIKTIYQQIPYEVEKRIYVTNPQPVKQFKKTIKKYKFYGSVQSGTYHTAYCRLSRLIKRKYKVGNDTQDYFKKNQYKPCKICILKKYSALR